MLREPPEMVLLVKIAPLVLTAPVLAKIENVAVPPLLYPAKPAELSTTREPLDAEAPA